MSSAAQLREEVTALLEAAGFLAAREDAVQLLARAAGDGLILDRLVRRRLAGEPLPWIVGSARFCDFQLTMQPGVYVPRHHTEELARRAVERLPSNGVAVDVCTGSGPVAAVLARARPQARVLATDVDPTAVACARANGVDAYHGDLFHPLPDGLAGAVDVVVAVVPYVPTSALRLLQRDTFGFETTLAYDGGPDGTNLLRRVATEARRYLRPDGALLMELGGDQAEQIADALTELGYADLTVVRDEEADPRGIVATYRTDGARPAP